MAQLFTNNAYSTIASAGITSGSGSVQVASGEGARFPSPSGGDFFDLTFTQAGTESTWEVARCTSRSGDVLTLGTRGVEGAAAGWAIGDKVQIRLTAAYLNSLVSTASSSGNDFRLSLTTALPVTTSDVTGATTIYCVPYKGNSIDLYNGTKWEKLYSAQFSLALGTLTSGTPYDVFCYNNAGTPTLEFAAWTDSTNRTPAFDLVRQDGVWCKSGALTRRYMGTFYTTSTTTTEDSAAKRYLWNNNNRVTKNLRATDTTGSWDYTILTWRQANASAVNQVEFICGLAEDMVHVKRTAKASSSTGQIMYAGVGLDTTTTYTGFLQSIAMPNGISAFVYPEWNGTVVGRHYVAAVEMSIASGVTTWVGNNASDLKGTILC